MLRNDHYQILPETEKWNGHSGLRSKKSVAQNQRSTSVLEQLVKAKLFVKRVKIEHFRLRFTSQK